MVDDPLNSQYQFYTPILELQEVTQISKSDPILSINGMSYKLIDR